MKIANETATVQTSREVEAHEMGIDAKNMAHIMSMLTDAYSNPVAAVIREYSANAIDAQRDAGVAKPISVTLPSPLSPTLVIQDNGIGLSKDDLIRVYSQYGASTKRDTNDQIGGFGIGAKSAFAVADQFTVQAVRDGMLTRVLFTRTKEGGSVNILAESKTDLPNGVKVSIPVDGDYRAYEREAHNLFYYWNPGDVQVEGFDHKHFSQHATKVAEGIHIVNYDEYNEARGGNNTDSRIVIRMGGIAYPLSRQEVYTITGAQNTYRLPLWAELERARLVAVVDAEIGTIDLVPSRESLLMNDRMKVAVKGHIRDTQAAIIAHFQTELEKQKSFVEAIRFYYSNEATFAAFTNVMTYKGKALPKAPAGNITAVSGSLTYKKKMQFSERAHWGSYQSPVIIVDTKGHALPKGELTDRYGTKVAHTGEQMALLDGKRGLVRRWLSPYLRSLDGTKPAAFPKTFGANTSVIFVLKHEVGNDPFIAARHTMTITADDLIAQAKAYQAANRANNRAANGTVVPAGTVGGTITYNTDAGDSLTVSEIIEHDHVFYQKVDAYHSAPAYTTVFAMPENSVLISLKPTQKVEAFVSRIDRATEGGIAALELSAWQTEQTEAMLAGLTEAERQYLESQQAYTDDAKVFEKIVKPLADKKDAVATERWNKLVGGIMATYHATTDKERLNKLAQAAHAKNIAIPEAKNGMREVMRRYPILAAVVRGMSWQPITDKSMSKNYEAVVATIEAFDTAASV